jgi:RHS repeat-associated protein
VIDAGDEVVERREFKSGTPTFTAPPTDYDATQLGHDPLERLTKVVDPAGNTWTFGHDRRGNETTASDPDEGASSSTYDAVGRTLTTTTVAGTIAFTYDELGRKTSTRSGSATGPTLAEWTYDTAPGGKGELASSTRYVDGAAYTIAIDGYDAGGRPTGTTVTIPDVAGKGETKLAGTYTIANSYTPTGEVATTTFPAVAGLPAETVNQAYTTSGLPSTVDNGTVVYVGGASYTPYGEVSQTTFGPLGDRVVRSRTYDPATRRPATVVTDRERTGPQTIDSTAYSYDANGNVIRIRTDSDDAANVDDQCFRYDHLARLREAWTATDACAGAPAQARVGGTAPYWQSFTYDAIGNRKTEVRHSAAGDVTRTYTYPAAGAAQPHTLRQVSTTGPGARTDTYEYDTAGNTKRRVTAAGDQQLVWGAEGRLAKSTIGGAETSFVYDADGERLLRRDPTSTTLYLDGQEITLVRAGGVLSGTRYYNGPDGTVARGSDGGLHYLLADRQGTDELSVDATTLAYTRRESTPFGGSRGTAPAAWPSEHGFVGGTVDPATGLVHLGAREYDQDTGRFISVDPVMDFEDPQQVNGYAYANNNPVTLSDPDGQRVDQIEDWCYYHKCNKKAKKEAIKRTNARVARENRAYRAYQKWLKAQKAKAKAAAKKRAAQKAAAKKKAKAKPKPKKKGGCRGFFGCIGHGLKKGWDKSGGKAVSGVRKHWRGITQGIITGAAIIGGAVCIMASAGICGGLIAGYAIAAGIGAGAGVANYGIGGGKHSRNGYLAAGGIGAVANVGGVYGGKVAFRAGASLRFRGSAWQITKRLFSDKKYWKP